jgi:putative chitinase
MMINRTTFYTYVKRAPFGGRLSPQQKDGLEYILTYWENHYSKLDIRWLAYALATTFHETGYRMQPIKETVQISHKDWQPSDKEVIRRLDAAFAKGLLGSVKTPYWRSGYFGRGLVQITHKDNYAKFGIAESPDKALDWPISLRILFDGMIRGMFAPGHHLGRYFNASIEDPKGARRIINGKDKAGLIADYYHNFLGALKPALEEKPPEDVPATEEEAAPSEPLIKDPQTITVAGGGLIATIIAAVNSPWGVAALAVLLGFGLIGFYIYCRKKEKYVKGV